MKHLLLGGNGTDILSVKDAVYPSIKYLICIQKTHFLRNRLFWFCIFGNVYALGVFLVEHIRMYICTYVYVHMYEGMCIHAHAHTVCT